MKTKKTKKMTRNELAAALAKAMNLLNDIDRDNFNNRQIGDFHELASLMPEEADYANNGTVMADEL
ncbi:MAG TPA: hypothetical protein VKD72_28110 [Gemmataceae bacterium]|nr:hypothetical protein [Gemmataceae bacterium]